MLHHWSVRYDVRVERSRSLLWATKMSKSNRVEPTSSMVGVWTALLLLCNNELFYRTIPFYGSHVTCGPIFSRIFRGIQYLTKPYISTLVLTENLCNRVHGVTSTCTLQFLLFLLSTPSATVQASCMHTAHTYVRQICKIYRLCNPFSKISYLPTSFNSAAAFSTIIFRAAHVLQVIDAFPTFSKFYESIRRIIACTMLESTYSM